MVQFSISQQTLKADFGVKNGPHSNCVHGERSTCLDTINALYRQTNVGLSRYTNIYYLYIIFLRRTEVQNLR